MMQICGRVTYLLFAKDDGLVRNRRDRIRVILFFRCEYKVVVAVAKRLKKMTRREQCECVYKDFQHDGRKIVEYAEWK